MEREGCLVKEEEYVRIKLNDSEDNKNKGFYLKFPSKNLYFLWGAIFTYKSRTVIIGS